MVQAYPPSSVENHYRNGPCSTLRNSESLIPSMLHLPRLTSHSNETVLILFRPILS